MEKDKSDCEPMCVFPEERDIIHDLRSLEFGRVSVFIQNGVMVNKEITKTIKNGHRQNKNNYRPAEEYQ
ncbi:MAG: hypothetical protein WA063_06685 [Minisyncoccia bacterium]